LPEIVTWGKDEEEALAMAREAIELVIEDRVANGEPLPAIESVRLRTVHVTVPA
jgi:antitoxin HicB